MTLSPDQCVEVAEKVWGWKWYPDNADNIPGLIDNLKENVFEQVNSWQGFGRTFERIVSHELSLSGFEREIERHIRLNANNPDWQKMKIHEMYIYGAHLAALECIKND